MSRDTNVLQDAWAGWLNFVREVVGTKRVRSQTQGLKRKVKPPNRAQLKRDLNVIRRPQPKRTKSAIREQ